jgi:hypothetical protein
VRIVRIMRIVRTGKTVRPPRPKAIFWVCIDALSRQGERSA